MTDVNETYAIATEGVQQLHYAQGKYYYQKVEPINEFATIPEAFLVPCLFSLEARCASASNRAEGMSQPSSATTSTTLKDR